MNGIIEFSVIHDGFRNSGMSIRPVGDCMKEPSLRGGAADAAIQKVFTGTDAALLDCQFYGSASHYFWSNHATSPTH